MIRVLRDKMRWRAVMVNLTLIHKFPHVNDAEATGLPLIIAGRKVESHKTPRAMRAMSVVTVILDRRSEKIFCIFLQMIDNRSKSSKRLKY